jgi:hypothetical protein
MAPLFFISAFLYIVPMEKERKKVEGTGQRRIFSDTELDDFHPKGVVRFKTFEEADEWMEKWKAWRDRRGSTSK